MTYKNPRAELSGDIQLRDKTEELGQDAFASFEVFGLTDDTSPELIRVLVIFDAQYRTRHQLLPEAEKLLSERILRLYQDILQNPPHQRVHSDPFSPL